MKIITILTISLFSLTSFASRYDNYEILKSDDNSNPIEVINEWYDNAEIALFKDHVGLYDGRCFYLTREQNIAVDYNPLLIDRFKIDDDYGPGFEIKFNRIAALAYSPERRKLKPQEIRKYVQQSFVHFQKVMPSETSPLSARQVSIKFELKKYNDYLVTKIYTSKKVNCNGMPYAVCDGVKSIPKDTQVYSCYHWPLQED